VGKLVSFSDYPVRLKIYRGESLAGFIFRYLGANGHKISHDWSRVLQSFYNPNLEVVKRAEKTIKPLLGDTYEYDFNKRLDHPGKYKGFRDEWLPLNVKKVRFCPACLRESGYHSALWELQLLHVCPIHVRALVAGCTKCHREFEWVNIYPGWCCKCGEAVTAMPQDTPKSGMVELARLLVYASDVNLPKDLKLKFPKPPIKSYELKDLYDALECGFRVARILCPGKYFVRDRLFYPDNMIIVPLPVIGWIAKILCSTNKELNKRLRRLLKRYFRESGTLINTIGRGNKLAQVMISLEKEPDCIFKEKLYKTFFESAMRYRCKLPINLLVLYDPRLTSMEFKGHLVHFAKWWEKLSEPMATQNRSGQLDIPKNYKQIKWLKNKESCIHELIKTLFEASINNTDIGSFSAFRLRWQIPESLRKTKPAYDSLNQLAVYLKTIPVSELSFIYHLVMFGSGKKKWTSYF
jgi:hypothetical protein